ncbi:conserved hypothetical protein [Ixodes scapularis]|uniref:Uncharacterized protein n=1 Tax=Ixodes scapularis TaxID=6945 RepID=B7P814_IXOSC|nr:conserved hypothetical protein [Ixodes scapularis]|eukprot:XP_002400498.1 conserved hypothetical protein [Ixodes scapularis]
MADDGGEEALDPRVQDANSAFRATLSESSHKLRLLSKKLGKAIEAARPYYEAKDYAHKAQLECQRAAVQYQRASEVHQAAKETISLAEQRFLSNQTQWEFDNAWQEMLNHATMKVMEAEAMRLESEREHRKRAASFTEAEHRVHSLERRLKKDIAKSRLYFEKKATFQQKLQEIKGQVETLRKAVIQSKQSYTDALHSLEQISAEIHEKRKVRLPPREPGVGAELLRPAVSGSDMRNSTRGRWRPRSTSAAHDGLPPPRLPGDGLSKAESESYGSLGSSPSNGSTLSLPTDLSKTPLADMLGGMTLNDSQFTPRQSPADVARGVARVCGPDEFEDVDLSTE